MPATLTNALGLKKPAIVDRALIGDLNDNFDLVDGAIHNVVNVKGTAYDAKGDGVTDDTNAINLAVAALGSKPGGVYFPDGTYVHTGITPPSNSTFFGPSRARAILKMTASGTNHAFDVSNVSNVLIHNLTIDVNRATGSVNSPTDPCGVYVYRSSYVRIRDCLIKNAKGRGYYAKNTGGVIDSTDLEIVNTRFDACDTGSIGLEYARRVLIDNCELANSPSVGMATGGCEYVHVVKRTIARNNGHDGITFGNDTLYSTIDDCIAHNNGAEGLNIDGGAYCTISNSFSYANVTAGIALWNRSPGSATAGFNKIIGNTVLACESGIIVSGDTSPSTGKNLPGCVVANNIVRSSYGAGVLAGWGIRVTDADRVIVQGNESLDNASYGLWVANCANPNVANNVVRRNAWYGLKIGNGVTRGIFADNVFVENGDGTTYFYAIDDTDVATSGGNKISGNQFVEDRVGVTATQLAAIRSTTTNNLVNDNKTTGTTRSPLITGAGTRQRDNTWQEATVSPTSGAHRPGDAWINSAPASGGTPGWVAVERIDTTTNGATGGSTTALNTPGGTTGMAVGDVIGVPSDAGVVHWTTIAVVVDVNALTLTDATPVGFVAASGNPVYTTRWKAMAVLA